DNLRPTGLSRTYPNLLTIEGVMGQEHFPTSSHNTGLPFTRALAGMMDYTPRSKANSGKTTTSHQLALPIIYFSPLTYMYWYSNPSHLEGRDELEMWRDLPTCWNESSFLSGSPRDHASVIRRCDDTWYFAFLNGVYANNMELPLSFLEAGIDYKMLMINDGENGSTAMSTYLVDSSYTISESVLGKGGITIRFEPLEGSNVSGISFYPPRISLKNKIIVNEDTSCIRSIIFKNRATSMSYNAHHLPDIVSFDMKSGSISLEPSNEDVGEFNLNISFSENDSLIGWYNTSLTIRNVNDPPILGGLPVYIVVKSGTVFNLIPTFFDIDPTDDIPAWNIETDSDFITIDAENGHITGRPDQFIWGVYECRVSVNDGRGGSSSHDLIIFVETDGVMLFISTRINVLTILEDYLFLLDMDAWMTDGRPVNLTWTMETDCTFINIDNLTGVISGVPGDEDVGDYLVNITVEDNMGRQDLISFHLKVIGINDLPEIIQTPQVFTVTVGKHLEVDLDATDVDDPDESLIWSLEDSPNFVSIDMETGILSLLPGEKDNGIYQLTLSVMDPQGGRTYLQMIIVVNHNGSYVNVFSTPVNRTTGDITICEWNYTLPAESSGDEDTTDDQKEENGDRSNSLRMDAVDWIMIVLLITVLLFVFLSFLKSTPTAGKEED
ncbi:MAG: glycoside hydrolase family 97 catalytic domain-containing protein, partial [Thermoplasmata archaeon]|nr:glycoside hydrolase family 97 catalytic domain-containing protein [Thermoplasmata archaeon]